MVTQTENKTLFKQVVNVPDSSGELKVQFSIDLSKYDTSEMDGYTEGSRVYKGYTCKLATLKPNKTRPKARIDIDPTDKEIRKAIMEMYSAVDKLVESK